MNGLTALIAVVVVIVAVGAMFYRTVCGRTTKNTLFIASFTGLVLVVSVCLYATLGRWFDYGVQKVDEETDYLLTAKITQAQRQVKNMPKSLTAQQELAQAYLEAGRYKEAAETYDICLTLGGDQIDLMGKKAYALYYRDGRKIGEETRQLIDTILAKNPLEVQTRMLLGQDAFMHERYQEAIGQWKMLLDSGAAPGQRRALENAIANAEQKARMKD